MGDKKQGRKRGGEQGISGGSSGFQIRRMATQVMTIGLCLLACLECLSTPGVSGR